MLKLIHKAAIGVLLVSLSGLVTYKVEAQTVPSLQPTHVSLASIKYHVFDSTTSPNKRYAVAWGIPGRSNNSPKIEQNDDFEKVENYLVDTKTNKVVTTLKYSKTFPNQNHSGLSAKWSNNSQSVLIIHNGKWQPRNVSIVNVNGVQLGIYDQLVKDTRAYLAKNDGAAYQVNKKRVVFAIDSSKPLQFNNNQLQVPINIYIPKALNGYEKNVVVIYQVSNNRNLSIKLLNFKNIK